MKEKTLLERLKFEGILIPDTFFVDPDKLWDISNRQLTGILDMCNIFRKYFSEEQYGILVVKTIIDYIPIQVAAYHSCSKTSLDISRYATPNKPMPSQIRATCNQKGFVKVAYNFGMDLKPIK